MKKRNKLREENKRLNKFIEQQQKVIEMLSNEKVVIDLNESLSEFKLHNKGGLKIWKLMKVYS